MSNTLPLTQVEVNVSRDPSRLYKLTAGWEQRKKEGPGTAGHGPSLHMPHRYATLFSHTIRPPFVRIFFSIAYHKEPGNPLNLLFCAPLLTEQLPSLQLMRGKIEAGRDLVSCVSHALGRPRFFASSSLFPVIFPLLWLAVVITSVVSLMVYTRVMVEEKEENRDSCNQCLQSSFKWNEYCLISGQSRHGGRDYHDS